MSRFSRYDTDEERLPEGMTRVGYDADTQTYSYRDADGSYWEGAPGNQYGQLTRVSNGNRSTTTNNNNNNTSEEDEPFITSSDRQLQPWEEERQSWRQEYGPLLNFFVLIGLFLIGVVWLMYWSRSSPPSLGDQGPKCTPDQSRYKIARGDTCWGIAQEKDISVEELLKANEGLNCDRLQVGVVICVPSADEE